MYYRPQTLKATLEDLDDSRRHTQEWYARHYGKLQDWARKRLPEPWRNEFFCCIANGLFSSTEDRGEPYTTNSGYRVSPSGYFRVDTAEGQLILDQTRRAEEAELTVQHLLKQIEQLLEQLSK